jgi:hypothetical protein
MAKKSTKGRRLTKTGKWKISSTKGTPREFSATLLRCINVGKHRIAIFSVPKTF